MVTGFLNKHDLAGFLGRIGFFAATPVSVRLTFSDMLALYIAFGRISVLLPELRTRFQQLPSLNHSALVVKEDL